MTAAEPRNAICLNCRTLLREGEVCDVGPRHAVTTLDKPGHDRLVDTVWGPPSKRHKLKAAAKAGGGGGVAGGTADACGSASGCGDLGAGCGEAGGAGGEVFAILVVIVIAALAAIAVYFIIAAIVRWVRARKNRPKPVGAVDRDKRLTGRGIEGVVKAAGSLTSPLSGTECVAFGIKLVAKRSSHGKVMLRAAETSGFDVELNDGSHAHVPAGRILLAPSRRETEIRRDVVLDYLRRVDPHHTTEQYEDPIPFDRGYEAVVKDGDRITLLGELRPALDPDGEQSYRHATTRLEFTGVPAFRVNDVI